MSPCTFPYAIPEESRLESNRWHVTLGTNQGPVSRPRRMEWLFL